MRRSPESRGLVCVGAVAGAFGVRGEIRLKSFCAEPEAIATYGPLLAEDGREFRLTLGRPVKGGFAARLSGVATRDAAEALKGVRLHVPRARLPEPGEDEYYHADLIGLPVRDTGGAALGHVTSVQDHGAGDILEISGPGGTLLLPFTHVFVPTVDLAGGRIVADPPEEAPDPDPDAGDGDGSDEVFRA